MGVDFIRRHAKKFNKKWDKDRLAVCKPDLFTRQPSAPIRSVVACPTAGAVITVDEEIVIRIEPNRAVAVKGITAIAEIKSLPPDVRDAVINCGGHVRGRVTNVSSDGMALEMEIWC
jgi:hypothetical protein